jgi:hypothetical protein
MADECACARACSATAGNSYSQFLTTNNTADHSGQFPLCWICSQRGLWKERVFYVVSRALQRETGVSPPPLGLKRKPNKITVQASGKQSLGALPASAAYNPRGPYSNNINYCSPNLVPDFRNVMHTTWWCCKHSVTGYNQTYSGKVCGQREHQVTAALAMPISNFVPSHAWIALIMGVCIKHKLKHKHTQLNNYLLPSFLLRLMYS